MSAEADGDGETKRSDYLADEFELLACERLA